MGQHMEHGLLIAPYGGYKHSGYGREMGFAVMRELMQEKRVRVNVR
jgi:acyl-CoA reductase-like NAD-dependent aldehyde dehydrogenase